MNYLEALEQLQLLDIEQLTLLEQAHWRYVAFMGICCPDGIPTPTQATPASPMEGSRDSCLPFLTCPPRSALPGMRSTFARPLALPSASASRRGKACEHTSHGCTHLMAAVLERHRLNLG